MFVGRVHTHTAWTFTSEDVVAGPFSLVFLLRFLEMAV